MRSIIETPPAEWSLERKREYFDWSERVVAGCRGSNAALERQLAAHAQRSQLIQRSLTSFYVALGLFVATTVSIGVVGMLHCAAWVPSLLGIAGTVVLFYGSMLFIAETRVALRSVNEEMAFVLSLPQRYRVQSRGGSENGQDQKGNNNDGEKTSNNSGGSVGLGPVCVWRVGPNRDGSEITARSERDSGGGGSSPT